MKPEFIVLINSAGEETNMPFDQFERTMDSRLRQAVASEGSIQAKCQSLNSFVDEESGEERLIANFNAVTVDMIPQIQQLLAEGDYQGAMRVTLTSNFRPDSSRFIPAIGEVCKLGIGTVNLREEGKTGLRIVSVSPLPKATTKVFSVADLMANVGTPNPEPATNAAPLSAAAIQGMGKDELLALAQANGIDVSSHLTGGGAIKAAAIPTVVALLTEELV